MLHIAVCMQVNTMVTYRYMYSMPATSFIVVARSYHLCVCPPLCYVVSHVSAHHSHHFCKVPPSTISAGHPLELNLEVCPACVRAIIVILFLYHRVRSQSSGLPQRPLRTESSQQRVMCESYTVVYDTVLCLSVIQ